MFDFFSAALQQQRSGNAVNISRRRRGIKTICVHAAVVIVCSVALLLAGHYSRLLFLAWFTAERPLPEQPYKLSTQRYFYKKQPLSEIATDAVEVEEVPAEDEQTDDIAPVEDNDIEPSKDNQAALRERVERAMKDLRP